MPLKMIPTGAKNLSSLRSNTPQSHRRTVMKTVQWRPEPNALTMPPSYSVRHIPRDTIGYDGVAERMVRNNPGLTKTQAEANLRAAMQAMLEELTEGNRITLEDALLHPVLHRPPGEPGRPAAAAGRMPASAGLRLPALCGRGAQERPDRTPAHEREAAPDQHRRRHSAQAG